MNEGYFYLSGPMSGYPAFNFPAFEAAYERLCAEGYSVVSPHLHDMAAGFDPTGLSGTEHEAYDRHAALAWDMSVIATPDCEGVVVLSGWTASSGARAEVALAQALSKPVFAYRPDNPSAVGRLNVTITAVTS